MGFVLRYSIYSLLYHDKPNLALTEYIRIFFSDLSSG